MTDLTVRTELSREDRDAIITGVTEAIRPMLESRPRLVDADTLGQILGYSRAHVDRLRASGAIPSIGEGRARRFDPSAVIVALSGGCE